MIQANRIYEFTTIPSFAVVIIFSLIKAVYIIKVTEKGRSTQIMSDLYGHKISKGELCLGGNYLGRSKNMLLKSLKCQTTKFCYLIRIVGIHKKDVLDLSREIWQYLQSKQIMTTSGYLASHLNVEEDCGSPSFEDNNKWKLSPALFHKCGTSTIDLFTSRMFHHLPVCMALMPDPRGRATNTIQ